MIRRQKKGELTRLTFALPLDVHNGAVSVVGDFNDWTPGTHTLVKRSNGTRSVTVAVQAGEEIAFRYLADGGVWFDDEDAHAITDQGSKVIA